MKIPLLKPAFLFLFQWLVLSGNTQTTYPTIGLIGSATAKGWEASAPMKQSGNDPHLWQATQILSRGELKFRANNTWEVNWGNSPFPSGIAVANGPNIPVAIAGTYDITFNDITGDYSFDVVSYAPPQKKAGKKEAASLATNRTAIFPEGAVAVEIFSGGEDFLEGPAMSPDGLLYFTDFSERTGTGIIWTLDPLTRASKVFRSPSGMANGLAFDAGGDLIACEQAGGGGRRVTKTTMKTGISRIIAGRYRNKPFNSPNDVAIDAKGRIYFTDPSYLADYPVEQNGMGVYRIDGDSSVHLVAANVAKPNGIAVSPDQKTLYVVNCDFPGNGTRWFVPGENNVAGPVSQGSVFAFDIRADGSLQLRSQLIDFGSSLAPDGMTVDAEGNLYIAVGNRVLVYDAAGTKLSEIRCPQATNVCFGRGKYNKTLFIAGGKSIYQVKTNKEGFILPEKK